MHFVRPSYKFAIFYPCLTLCRFFKTQPKDIKHSIRKELSANYNGYSAVGTVHVSPSESVDNKESFQWRYDPRYDPMHSQSSLSSISPEVLAGIRGEEFVWEGTKHIEGFKDASITYWQECLSLARRLIRLFALALDLEEDHFDSLVTYPGADGVYNFYPGKSPAEAAVAKDVGLGSHTDLQCFTLLWQDLIGGLQILTRDGQWIKATPIPGTIVVNIGDFLQRVSNDCFVSTVHRVFSRARSDRISMPFFFGFNFNEKVGVLESCLSDGEVAKYEPMSCGEVRQKSLSVSNIQVLTSLVGANRVQPSRYKQDRGTCSSGIKLKHIGNIANSFCLRIIQLCNLWLLENRNSLIIHRSR